MRRLEKTISDIGWTRTVPQLARTERVARAFDVMSREKHDCVLITRDRKVEGIFTGRDFLNRIAAVRADPAAVELGDVMTANPRTLRPRDGVVFAINWMAIEGFRNVPIVDDAGQALGVLTVWDVMRHLESIFQELDATPRRTLPSDDLSALTHVIDIGGG
jgi:CBS domain-containing protein